MFIELTNKDTGGAMNTVLINTDNISSIWPENDFCSIFMVESENSFSVIESYDRIKFLLGVSRELL